MTDFSKAALIERYNFDQDRPEFVFFWGPGEAHLPKACFNQWHPAKFEHRDLIFANAEQAMMAEKAFLFQDYDTLEEILECESPRAVKALGRLVQNYDDATWAKVRLHQVVGINYQKFKQNPTMLAALLATGDAILVEASPVDRIWGIGMKEGTSGILDPRKWKGQNLLGEALMIVRERFQMELANE